MGKAERLWKANEAEHALAALIEARGKSELIRHGWPDFMLQRKSDKKLFGVEVKNKKDEVSPRQAKCFEAFEAGGIPVLVWNPAYPARFTPWRKYNELMAKRNVDGIIARKRVYRNWRTGDFPSQIWKVSAGRRITSGASVLSSKIGGGVR